MIALLVGVLTSTALLWSSDAPRAGARPSGRLVPAQGALLGAWMRRDDATTQSTKKQMIERREAEMGRRFDIVNRFYPFENSFPGWAEEWDLANGRIPSISWGAVDTNTINNGSRDSLIRTRARAVAALDGEVFLRWFWEADGAYQDGLTHTPASYVNAWKRVRRIFLEEGATNAVWTWCATSWGFATGEAAAYYPGDDQVDWVCANGYNWAPLRDGSDWVSWETIYRPAHDFAVAHDKPLMAGEWGALERNPGDKAEWIDNATRTIRTSMPYMAAVVAFDEKRTNDRYATTFNWQVDSSGSSRLAFLRMARDPHFTIRTPAAPAQLSLADVRVWEGNKGTLAIRVPVSLDRPADTDVTVRLSVTAGTASSADFVPVERTVRIAKGTTRAEPVVEVKSDTVNENRESFRVRLADATGAVIADGASGGVLVDDDPATVGTLHVMAGDVTIAEGDAGERTLRVPITTTATRSKDIEVDFDVVGWTAQADDYKSVASGTVVIPAGERQGAVFVAIRGDVVPEGAEAVFVRLLDTSAGTISDDVGVVTITADD